MPQRRGDELWKSPERGTFIRYREVTHYLTRSLKCHDCRSVESRIRRICFEPGPRGRPRIGKSRQSHRRPGIAREIARSRADRVCSDPASADIVSYSSWHKWSCAVSQIFGHPKAQSSIVRRQTSHSIYLYSFHWALLFLSFPSQTFDSISFRLLSTVSQGHSLDEMVRASDLRHMQDRIQQTSTAIL
jgi:hypothetical protein